jgi:hypothetical protein
MLAKCRFALWSALRLHPLLFSILVCCLSCGIASATESFLSNGQITLGVRADSGACIDYFSRTAPAQNVINSYDRGRFIQQSYYGDLDGSSWMDQPWSWNPIQGGSANGQPSTLLEFANMATVIYAKTMPKRWSTGADAPHVTMEEAIELSGNYAHVHYRMIYTGSMSQDPRDQELPAVFVDRNLGTLVYYKGQAPWTGAPLTRIIPADRNGYDRIDENWAAYLNAAGWGVGVYVPGVDRITFYLHNGKTGPGGDGCSYFAPIATFPVTMGLVFEYHVYLTLGTADQIRQTFQGIHRQLQQQIDSHLP